MNLYTERTTCRACSYPKLEPVLDLGSMAISDFPKPGEPLDYAPLTLVRCPRCELVQLRHTVNRDRLYRDYWYSSGLNETMIAALADVAEDAQKRVQLEVCDAVLDIGANDGTLLRQYPRFVRRLGFEPSNVAPHDPSLHIWRDYFPSTKVQPPEGGCKIITACAMFYDLDDPGGFLAEVKRWLHPQGVFVVQMPDLWQMLRRNAFDNICHEHVTYWPTRALFNLARTYGLKLLQMSNNNVNGGSLRYTFGHGRVEDGFAEQKTNFYESDLPEFARNIQRIRSETVDLLFDLAGQGKRIWAYGASTKGNTLLQYYGLDAETIGAVADRNPDKWGKETVTGIPIVSEEEFRKAKPDYAIVLPWGFLDAFVAREREYLEGGGRFIVPLPKLQIIGRDGDEYSQSKDPPPKARAGLPARHASIDLYG